jgi:hypothetical protein
LRLLSFVPSAVAIRTSPTSPRLIYRAVVSNHSITCKMNAPPTCFYWKRDGNCRNRDSCAFAHFDTGVYATEPGRSAKVGKSHHSVWSYIFYYPNRHPTADISKSLTCFYWHRGFCQKSDDDCIYAHYNTGRLAPEPGRKSFSPILLVDLS